ncbi:MAG: GAF domain-containing sensor histidine kinase [Chloroflexota bacterium]
MSKTTRKSPNKIQFIRQAIKQQFRGLTWIYIFMALIVLPISVVVGLLISGSSLTYIPTEWPRLVWFSLGFLILLTLVFLLVLRGRSDTMRFAIEKAAGKELKVLRSSYKKNLALQEMAYRLRATLNLDEVLESALNVCTLGMQDAGVPEKNIVAGIMLYEGDELKLVARRRMERGALFNIDDSVGAINKSMNNAEPIILNDIDRDPVLSQFGSFRRCRTAVVIPLRVRFQIYGAMVIGSEVKFKFGEDSMELFLSVADQMVIALQNAQLAQDLVNEKQKLMEAETEARRQLARDLHDGPTQTVSAIAMRLNFIRNLIDQDSEEAKKEIDRVEEMAKNTAKDIRGMLFTLRPLVLETQGLGPALETIMNRISEETGIVMRLTGGETGDLLNPQAQSVLFHIIEEALGNARKHSNASNIDVRLWNEDGLVVTRIQDDGVGFAVDDVMGNYSSRGSLGMINMRERAETIDGSIQVNSAPGKGTAITVVVPLDRQGQFVR